MLEWEFALLIEAAGRLSRLPADLSVPGGRGERAEVNQLATRHGAEDYCCRHTPPEKASRFGKRVITFKTSGLTYSGQGINAQFYPQLCHLFCASYDATLGEAVVGATSVNTCCIER